MRPTSATLSVEGRRLLDAIPLDRTLLSGARNVVDVHLRVSTGERATVVFDASEQNLARAVLGVLTEIGAEAAAFVLAPDVAESDSLSARIATAISTSDAVVHVYREPPRTGSGRAQWIAAGRGKRHALLVGVSATVAMQSLRANPLEISRISDVVGARIARAREIEVATVTGTQAVARPFDSDAVRIDDGSVGDERPVPLLPTGEVLRACTRLDGEVVADGGIWIDQHTAFGLATRVTLRFDGGSLCEVRGLESQRIVETLEASRVPLTVAAIGFGTNPTVLTPVRELAQDTRMPGCHIVLGRARELDDPTSPRIHLLVRRPDVRLDGAPLMVNGRYAREVTG